MHLYILPYLCSQIDYFILILFIRFPHSTAPEIDETSTLLAYLFVFYIAGWNRVHTFRLRIVEASVDKVFIVYIIVAAAPALG